MPTETDPPAPPADGSAVPRVLIVKERGYRGRSYPERLGSKGFDVTDMFHGSGAMSALVAGGYDLLVIELHYLGDSVDDLTPLHLLRRDLGRKDVPVIVGCVHRGAWTPEHRADLNVSDVFDLPIDPTWRLVEAALRALGIGQAPAQPRWQYPFPKPATRQVA